MNYIEEYWSQIESGKETVGKKIRRTYQKVIDDLNNPGEFFFSEKRAQHVIDFFEKYCKHSKGKMGGQPVYLELWEKAMLSVIFGFVDINGLRKYQKAVLIIGKKNGKSLIASGVGLYLQIADGEPGAEVYAVATKKDQAKIIWLESKRMVMKSKPLRKIIKPLVAELSSEEFNNGVFKPLASDQDTLDGLNVSGALMDEFHQWKNGKPLYDIIADGIVAREQPLIFMTSTAGTVRGDIYDIEYEEAEMLIKGYDDGNYKDERTICFIYEIDAKEEWKDPKCWKKANPGLGTIKNERILAEKVDKAKQNPLLVKNLVCKEFNVRETSVASWLSFEDFNNTATFDMKELKPRYGIGGVDLSSTTDLTNATLLFKVPGDETIYVEQMYWLPEETIKTNADRDKMPYEQWVERGLMRTTPGNKVDYRYIVDWFREMQIEKDIYIYKVGYDSWSAEYFVKDMQNEFGKQVMDAVIQGKKTLSSPMKSLGADLKAGKINYNNNPITKWCIGNTSVDIDKNNNIQPAKGTSALKRIDGLAGLLDAYVTLERVNDEYCSVI